MAGSARTKFNPVGDGAWPHCSAAGDGPTKFPPRRRSAHSAVKNSTAKGAELRRGMMNRPSMVIYRDDRLVVLDKPSGLLAVPGRGPDLQDCLSARIQAELPGALVVHRL